MIGILLFRLELFFIQIGFSTISSWFVEKQGEIIWLNLIEEDNIVNPAVCN